MKRLCRAGLMTPFGNGTLRAQYGGWGHAGSRGTPGAGCAGGAPAVCRLEAPAGACAHWHFLPCVWAVDSHILCCYQGGGEDGGRDASPRRPCWDCERLEGCKGRDDGSQGSQPGGLGARVTLPRTGVGGTSAPLTPCLGSGAGRHLGAPHSLFRVWGWTAPRGPSLPV